jgi:hypothetical protein
MFELILSNTTTGSVRRKFFPTRDQAEQYVAQVVAFFGGSSRNYRVEIYPRPLPVVAPRAKARKVSRETAA